METQIREHFEKISLLPTIQSGLERGTTVYHIVDDIVKAIDDSKCTVLVHLDFSRAFDTIDYSLLDNILHYIGFSGSARLLVNNYL